MNQLRNLTTENTSTITEQHAMTFIRIREKNQINSGENSQFSISQCGKFSVTNMNPLRNPEIFHPHKIHKHKIGFLIKMTGFRFESLIVKLYKIFSTEIF